MEFLNDLREDLLQHRKNIEEKRRRQEEMSNKTIIIDAGHGGSDPGVVGHDGLQEKDFAFHCSLFLADMLKEEGYNVLLSREDDVKVPLRERVRMHLDKDPDLFVSVHANGVGDPSAHGAEVVYYGGENAHQPTFEKSQNIAQTIQNHMVQKMEVQDRKIKTTEQLGRNLAVLDESNNNQLPAVLVEPFFITNPDEAERFAATDEGVKKVSEVLKDAIIDSLG